MNVQLHGQDGEGYTDGQCWRLALPAKVLLLGLLAAPTATVPENLRHS